MDTSLFRLDEAHLRLLGRGLLILGLSLIVAMSFLGPVKPAKGMLPRGFTMPMLAIELPKNGEEVAAIVRLSGKGETTADQAADGERRMKSGLLFDLGIILLYGSTLAALGLLLYQSPAPGLARIAGAVAAVLGVMAGLLDVVENVRIWKVIDGARDAASLDDADGPDPRRRDPALRLPVRRPSARSVASSSIFIRRSAPGSSSIHRSGVARHARGHGSVAGEARSQVRYRRTSRGALPCPG